MKYIKEPDKLASVVKILATHEMDTKRYYLSHLSPRVAKIENVRDRLAVLFAVANKQRRGIGKGNEKLTYAVAHFHQGIDQRVKECEGVGPQKAHQIFLEWLCCDIEGMDQKTANLFLKWLAMFHNDFEIGLLDWQSWKPHLHVPLDRWVVRLIGKDYLDVCTTAYEHDFPQDKVIPGFKKTEYIQLQEEIGEVALLAQEPRIAMDVLWFIGNMYCTYHPLLCRACWIGGHCRHCASLNLQRLPTKPKPEIEKERRKERQEKHQQWKQYMKEHPEEVERVKKKYGLDKI